MNTDLTVHTVGAVAEKMDWAQALAPSPLLPAAYRRNPANLILAAEFADALHIERINAITSIHVIEGKPSASADLIAALVRRAGHRLRVTGDDRSCTATLVRADDPDFEYSATWDMPKAQRAGLAGKAVWKSYPGAMLRSRAITEVARQAASDALLGVIYTPEELGADVDQSGAPTRPTHVGTGRVTVAEILGTDVEDVQDAEVVPDEPYADAGRVDDMLLALELAKVPGPDRLAFVAEAVGRTVDRPQDLTVAEVDRVIDAARALTPAPAPDVDPATDAEWLAGGEPA